MISVLTWANHLSLYYSGHACHLVLCSFTPVLWYSPV